MRRRREDLHDDAEDKESDDIPLHRQKPFGSGLKRKKVDFVRASEPDKVSKSTNGASTDSQVGDLYASIVLGTGTASATPSATEICQSEADTVPDTCKICDAHMTTSLAAHEASLAHQIKLPHAHPPSALDRSRIGLRVLESHGWDPDARHGLGREGEGVRFPLKTRAKNDTLGIGASAPSRPSQELREPLQQKLTGKDLKLESLRQRSRSERLQAEIFGRLDVEGYLYRKMGDDE